MAPGQQYQWYGVPEPVPFAGDKRVWMAEYFYNIDNPVMRQLHKQYIMKMLDAFADEPNVIQSIGEEYTGPYHFTKLVADRCRMGG